MDICCSEGEAIRWGGTHTGEKLPDPNLGDYSGIDDFEDWVDSVGQHLEGQDCGHSATAPEDGSTGGSACEYFHANNCTYSCEDLNRHGQYNGMDGHLECAHDAQAMQEHCEDYLEEELEAWCSSTWVPAAQAEGQSVTDAQCPQLVDGLSQEITEACSDLIQSVGGDAGLKLRCDEGYNHYCTDGCD